MSKECPKTGAGCHDPLCEGDICLQKRGRGIDPYLIDEFEKLMKSAEIKICQDKDTTIAHLSAAIDRLTRSHEGKHQRVKQVLFTNFNNNKFITMALTLATNQSAPIVLGLVDADTLAPITATFTGETETSDNTAVATTDPVLGLVAVQSNLAGGSGNLTSVATWTYTDKNTSQPVTVTLTTVTPFTVTVVVTAERVQQVVSLGVAVTQPPVVTA